MDRGRQLDVRKAEIALIPVVSSQKDVAQDYA